MAQKLSLISENSDPLDLPDDYLSDLEYEAHRAREVESTLHREKPTRKIAAMC